MENSEKDKDILVCEECGSSAIQVLCWVDANTSQYCSEHEGDTDDHWCEECQEHTRFCTKSRFIKKMDSFARERGFAWNEDATYDERRKNYNRLKQH